MLKLGRAKFKVKEIVIKASVVEDDLEEIKGEPEEDFPDNIEERPEEVLPSDDGGSDRCSSEYDEENEEVRVIETIMN